MYKGGILLKIRIVAILAVVLILGFKFLSPTFETPKAQAPQSINTDKKSVSTFSVGLEKDQQAPDFTLSTLTGESVKLSSLRGKTVILNFWTTWCPPCKFEMPDMQQFYSDYKKNNIIIIGVNLTDNESNTKQVKDFTKQYKISFPILLDTKGEIRKQYKIITIPTTYIIDSNGIIAENVIGPITYDKIKKLTLNSANIKKG